MISDNGPIEIIDVLDEEWQSVRQLNRSVPLYSIGNGNGHDRIPRTSTGASSLIRFNVVIDDASNTVDFGRWFTSPETLICPSSRSQPPRDDLAGGRAL